MRCSILRSVVAIAILLAVPLSLSLADDPPTVKPAAEFDIRDADGNALITADQIQSYDWATHTLNLAPGVRAKLKERLFKGTKLVSGIPFAVCVGGKAVYGGRLTTLLSSFSFATPVIVVDQVTQEITSDQLRIELRYPAKNSFKGEDPRADQRIDAALRAAGKLADTRDDRIRWVAASLLEMQTIKQGSTREELKNVFVEEGGLSNRFQRRYAYRDCPYFKVDVKFNAADNADEKLEERPNDKVSQISTPFLEWPIAD